MAKLQARLIPFVSAPPGILGGLVRGEPVLVTRDGRHITTNPDGKGPNNLESLPRF